MLKKGLFTKILIATAIISLTTACADVALFGIDEKSSSITAEVDESTNDNLNSVFEEVEYVFPTAKELEYNGEEQELVNAGSTSFGVIEYRLNDGEYSASIPTAIDAGAYNVYFKVKYDETHEDSEERFINVVINKKEVKGIAPKGIIVDYDDSSVELAVPGVAEGLKYEYRLEYSEFSENVPVVKSAGTYRVYYRLLGNKNYEAYDEGYVLSTVVPAPLIPISFTAPTGISGLSSTTEQALINPGTCVGGTFYYRVEATAYSTSYSTTLPKVKSGTSGEYKVYYKIVGDEGYEDVFEHCISVDVGSGCLTKGSLVMLADGTYKKVEELTSEDLIMSYDLKTGKMIATAISLILAEEHSDGAQVITLSLSNGEELSIVDAQTLLSMDKKDYITVNCANYESLIGTNIMGYKDGSYCSVKILDAKMEMRSTSSYEIYPKDSDNYIASGVVSRYIIFSEKSYFVLDDEYKIDQEQLQKDIETYGLFDYSKFEDYINESTFYNYGFAYDKITIGKGYISQSDYDRIYKVFFSDFKDYTYIDNIGE